MGRKLPKFLKDDEVSKLLGAAKTERDRLIGLTMLMVGLRVSEVAKLDIGHVDFSRGLLWARDAKGGKDRCIPLPQKLRGPLRGWIGSRTEGPVFPSPRGGRLTTRAIQLLIKRLAKAARFRDAAEPRRFHPHCLRHVFASRLLESGATIHEVQRLMGHNNLATTSQYLHCLSDDRLRAAVDRPYGQS